MAFMKVDKAVVNKPYRGKRSSVDRLYLMEITVPGLGVVYKIGKASGHSSKDRMLQIVGSMFDVYRETPIVRIVRDRECSDVFAVETRCHRRLKEWQISVEKKWSGCTECFEISREDALKVYEEELGA
jgi:hypothetical protein